MPNRIRQLRKERNLTQLEIAHLVGVKEPTISNYETGKREPDKETWIKLAGVLGVTVDYLMGLSNASTEKTAAPKGDGLSDGAKRLVERYENASEEDRRRILAVVDAVVGTK